MNRHLYIFLHVAIWAFMFLSPLTYLRGNGMSWLHYVMNCMSPFLMMVVFYVNYFWLTPKCFVIGKRRYYMLVNFIMVVVFGIFLHNWVGFTNSLFMPIHIGPALILGVAVYPCDILISERHQPVIYRSLLREAELQYETAPVFFGVKRCFAEFVNYPVHNNRPLTFNTCFLS